MKTNLKAQIKALELDPKKKYFLIVDKGDQITMTTLSQLVGLPDSNIKYGLFVEDINNVQLHELEKLQAILCFRSN